MDSKTTQRLRLKGSAGSVAIAVGTDRAFLRRVAGELSSTPSVTVTEFYGRAFKAGVTGCLASAKSVLIAKHSLWAVWMGVAGWNSVAVAVPATIT